MQPIKFSEGTDSGPVDKGLPVLSGRAPKHHGLTPEGIVTVALRIVDERGLEALTMRSLAKEMGVYPSALHWHVGTKAQLVGAVAARIFSDVVVPDDLDIAWDEWLIQVAYQWRNALRNHPNLVHVAGSQLVMLTQVMPIVERILRVLKTAGFEGEALLNAYNTYIGCVVGWLTLELSAAPADSGEDLAGGFAAHLDSLDPNQYPILGGVMPAFRNRAFMLRWSPGLTHPMETSFAFVLRALIAGLKNQLVSETG